MVAEPSPPKTYDVVINGVQVAVQLSDEVAMACGLTGNADDTEPHGKARKPATKRAEAAAAAFRKGAD